MHITGVLEGAETAKRVEEMATFYNLDTRKIITPRNLEKKSVRPQTHDTFKVSESEHKEKP